MGIEQMKREFEERLKTQKEYYEGVINDGGQRIRNLTELNHDLQARVNEEEFLKRKLERVIIDNARLEQEVFDLTCEIRELTSYGDED